MKLVLRLKKSIILASIIVTKDECTIYLSNLLWSSIDPSDDNSPWDVIMWMDHRAKLEAMKINELGHPVLQSVGGSISLEMQTPKLMWLKKNKPDIWKEAIHFFDLSDFLTWRATGLKARSLCSAVCKWTYNGEGNNEGWSQSYFRSIGLEDLIDNTFDKIGKEFIPPGNFIGYLLPETIKEMGLGMSFFNEVLV